MPISIKNYQTITNLYAADTKDANLVVIPYMRHLDFMNLLKYVLHDACDFLVKRVLNEYKGNQDYYVLGGKAINYFISKKHMKQSFDFDIHLIASPLNPRPSIDTFGMYMEDHLNRFTNLPYMKGFRRQLFENLKNHNIVDDSLLGNYMNDNLFFYGARFYNEDESVGVSGIFIMIRCRDNLYREDADSKERNIKYSNYKSSDKSEPPHNIIYLPISDIDLDSFNFGIPNNSNFITTGKDNIRYASYLYLVFNLINDICTRPAKRDNSLMKLKKMICYQNLSCEIVTDDSKTFFDKLVAERKSLSGTITGEGYKVPVTRLTSRVYPPILFNNLDVFSNVSNPAHFVSIIRQAYQNIQTTFPKNSKINNTRVCRNHVLDNTSTEPCSIFNDGIEIGLPYTFLERAVLEQDSPTPSTRMIRGTIYEYTKTPLSRPVNTFCNYMALNISTGVELYRNIDRYEIKHSTGVAHTNVYINNQSIGDICTEMDTVFDNVFAQYSSASYANIFARIKDIITVYSFQEIYTFNDGKNPKISINYLNIGDIFVIPSYVSASYCSKYNHSSFSQYYKVLLKINIHKNCNRWILLNKYSDSPTEYEILIKRGSAFIIDNIDYQTVLKKGLSVEYITLTVRLCDDIAQALTYGSEHIKYDPEPITNDVRFTNAIEYAYDNFLCRQYPGDELQIMFYIWRYNHALANSMRKSLYVPVIAAYLQRSTKSNLPSHLQSSKYTYTYDNILKLSIATLFAVCGRKGEEGFVDDGKKYMSYLRDSANMFGEFATKMSDLFSADDITSLNLIIIDKVNLKNTDAYAWIMSLAHDLEMLRLRDMDLSIMEQAFTQDECATIINMVQECLKKGGEIVHTCTVNGRRYNINNPPTQYDSILFPKANSDIKYYMKLLNDTLYPRADSIGILGVAKEAKEAKEAKREAKEEEVVGEAKLEEKEEEVVGDVGDVKDVLVGGMNSRVENRMDKSTTYIIPNTESDNIELFNINQPIVKLKNIDKIIDNIFNVHPNYFNPDETDSSNIYITRQLTKLLKWKNTPCKSTPIKSSRKSSIIIQPGYADDNLNLLDDDRYCILKTCFIMETVEMKDSTYMQDMERYTERYMNYVNLLFQYEPNKQYPEQYAIKNHRVTDGTRFIRPDPPGMESMIPVMGGGYANIYNLNKYNYTKLHKLENP